MPGSFDPYHKWLGISPKDQPPNHYRLLGIDLLESDPDVISSAADQRMAHVRAFQTGKHSALSQEILNEIAAARICLLNAEKKAEYDRQLHPPEPADGPAESPPGMPIPPAAPPLDETVPPRFEAEPARPWMRQKKVAWQALAGISVAAVLFIAILLTLLNRGGSQDVAQSDPDEQTSVEPDPFQGPDTDPESTEPRDPPDNDPEAPGPSQQNDPPPETPPTDPPPTDPAPTDPPPTSDPTAQVAQAVGMGNDPTPEPQPQTLPPPDAATEAAAEERLKETLAGRSAAELLQAAQAPDRPPDESFVLLKKALDSAAAAGDVSTALAATDEIVRRYEIDALETRAETLGKLRTSVTDPSAASALAESGLALVDEAVAGGKNDLAIKAAEHTVGVAGKSNDTALHRRAVLQFLKLKDSS